MLFSHSLVLTTGVSETVALNMSTLGWSTVTTVQGRVPLASEVFNVLTGVWVFKSLTSFFFFLIKHLVVRLQSLLLFYYSDGILEAILIGLS